VSLVRDRESPGEREALFGQAAPFAHRSTQVRTAALAGHDATAFDSEDIGQEVLLRLWRALGSYDPSRSSLRTYTETIVISTITSVLRRGNAKKRKRLSDAPKESVELSLRIERRIDLGRGLQKLGRFDRRVARLLLREYRPAEVAKKLGTSRTSVYRSIDRIRLALTRAGFG
jgi:RNA polymerase sigma-70 factor (ECF subfamily)